MKENINKKNMLQDVRLHASVFGLFARCSIFKVAGVLCLMGLVQMVLFVKLYLPSMLVNDASFLQALAVSKVSGVCLVGFVLITIVLCKTGTEYSSKTSYTLKRLSISEQSTFLMQALYNIFIYVLFVGFQLAMIFLLGWLFQNKVSGNVNSQFLFLAFYQNYFLHALFPMEDGLLWFRNICWLLALGVVTADFPYVQRRCHKVNTTLIVMIAMVLGFGGNRYSFTGDAIGALGNCIFTSFVALAVVGCVLVCTVFEKGDSYEN